MKLKIMRYPIVWTLIFCHTPFHASAQIPQDVFDYNLSSPYNTIVTHFGCLKEGNYYPEIAAETFSQEHRSQQEAIKLATELHQILQKNRVNIDLAQVPKDAHFIDPEAKYHRYQLTDIFPEIYLVKIKNKWLYSEETARSIATLTQKKSYPLGIKKLQESLPSSLREEFWGLYPWQYIFLVALILLASGVYRVIIYTSKKWLSQSLKRRNTSYIRIVARILGILTSLPIPRLFLPALQLPAAIEQCATRLLNGALMLAITALCYQWIKVITPSTNTTHVKNTEQLHIQLRQLAQPFLQVLIVIVGALITLKILQFDISHMLAGLSIGGIGLALASQDTIKNFFGTLTICMDQPFGINDTIVIEDIKGKVEAIGLRATRIRTHYQSMIYIPNGKLADTHIDNHGLQSHRRFDVHIAIACETAPALIEAFKEGLGQIKIAHNHIRQDNGYHTYLEGIHNTILKMVFRVYLDAPNQVEELQYRHEILNSIAKLAEKLSIPLISLSPT